MVVRVGSLTVANTAVDQHLLPGQRTARRPRLDSRRGGPFTGFARALAARPILQAAAFLLLSLLTHLPGFTRALWNPDEAFLGTQGRVLAGGGRLYVDVVDRKPPILPTYALAVTIGGDNAIWLMRGFAVPPTRPLRCCRRDRSSPVEPPKPRRHALLLASRGLA